MLNVNCGKNQDILERCRSMREYALLVEKVRSNVEQGMKIEQAVEKAVVECIEEDILKEFLSKHRAEVANMLLYEYDEEKHSKSLVEYGREEGRQEGVRIMIKNMAASGIGIEEIAKIAGYREEEVREIIKSDSN